MRVCQFKAAAKAAGKTRYFTDTPCVRGHSAARMVSNGNCVECLAIKHKAFLSTDRERARCREKSRLYRAKNPDKCRAVTRRWHRSEAGQTWAKSYRKTHKTHLEVQRRRQRGLPEPSRPKPETCECCGALPGKRSLHLDHDHVTGKFRGWLCARCNLGIGLLGDSRALLDKVEMYLLCFENGH